MKLLSSTTSPYTRKVRIVLAEKKIECELQPVDVQPVENPVNAHNPLGKIPTLVLDDRTALCALEAFHDLPRVVERHAAVENQRRDLAERVVRVDRVLDRLDIHRLQLALDLLFREHDAHFAGIGAR